MANESIPSPTGRDPQVGDYLGHYRLVQLLGAGGMGVVFKAYEEALNRNVAIKVLSRKLAGDRDFVTRFLHEAQAVASLNHPNITQIYYIAQQEDVLFFAMEYVEGTELDSYTRSRQHLEFREATEYIRHAAMGLQHAQKHGVIHRDIKPANLMVNHEGVTKVCDFGLAKEVHTEKSHTATQTVMGTPYYMSPEQARGERVTHHSDIYSLGASYFQMLAGRPPFIGDTSMAIMIQHIQEPLPQVQQFNPTVPLTVNHILFKAMAKTVVERYQSYAELIHDLDHLLAAPLPHASFAASPENSQLPEEKQRSPVAIFVLLLIIAALGASLWFSLKKNNSNPPPTSPPVVDNSQQNVTPPSDPLPPPSSGELKLKAEQLLVEQQAQAQPLLDAKQFGAALAKYPNWPNEYAKTDAWNQMMTERGRIYDLAKQALEKVKTEAAQLRLYDKYADALALYDQFQPQVAGIEQLITAIQTERQAVLAAKKSFEETQTIRLATAQRELEERYRQVTAPVADLLSKLQFEDAQKKVVAIIQETTDAALKDRIANLQTETDRFLALKQTIVSRLQKNPPATLTLLTATGERTGKLTRVDSTAFILSYSQYDSTVKATISGEHTIPWSKLLPSEVLRLFATYLDQQNADELLAHGGILFYGGRFDETKRTLQAAVAADLSKTAIANSYLIRIAESERNLLEQNAKLVWERILRNANPPLRDYAAVKRDLTLLQERYAESDFVKNQIRDAIGELTVRLGGEMALDEKRKQLSVRERDWKRGKVIHVGKGPAYFETIAAALRECSKVDPNLIILHEGQYPDEILIRKDLRNVEIIANPGDLALLNALVIESPQTDVTLSGLVFAGNRISRTTPRPTPVSIEITTPTGANEESSGHVTFSDCAFLTDGILANKAGTITIENCLFASRYFDFATHLQAAKTVRFAHNTVTPFFQKRDENFPERRTFSVGFSPFTPNFSAPTQYEVRDNIFARAEQIFLLSLTAVPDATLKRLSDNNFYRAPRGLPLAHIYDPEKDGYIVVPNLKFWQQQTKADTNSVEAESAGFIANGTDNYQLAENSPCRGKASDKFADGKSKDLGINWTDDQWKTLARTFTLLKSDTAPKWTLPSAISRP